MKIGYLSERLIQGFGMDLLIHNQANELCKLGHEVTVYTQNHDDFYKDRLYKVVKIESPLFVNPIKTEYNLIKRKVKFFRNENVDAWVSTMYPFHSLIPFLKAPVFIIEGGTVSSKGMSKKQRLVFWYQRYFNRYFYYSFAKKIIPFSNYLVNQIPFFLRHKTIVNYIGANHYTSEYKRDDVKIANIKNKLGLKDTDIHMLYIGRLNPVNQPYKGVKDLLEIYAEAKTKVPNLKLIMAGYGNDEDEKFLKSQGVFVLKNASDEELLLLLDLCDFYVSATKWEGFNLPMVESQSFGKIPVIYNIGPHKELTNSGIDSFIVENQKEFIDKVVFLAKNKEFRNNQSNAAIKNAQKYTWVQSAKNLEKIIKENIQ